MKRLHTSIFLASLLALMVVFSTSTLYAADCANATIERVGTNPVTGSTGASPYMVQLDCADDSIWPGVMTLYLSQDLGDSGLATLLSAYSMGKSVWVRTLGTTPGSIVSIIYVND